jgi:hypothetical protein
MGKQTSKSKYIAGFVKVKKSDLVSFNIADLAKSPVSLNKDFIGYKKSKSK